MFVFLFASNFKMNECFGEKFILNGALQSVNSFDNSLVYEGSSVYEVIRMVKGSPVFFYDHMDRLASSVNMQGKKMLADVKELRRDIINLTKTERKKEKNLKIVFNYNNDSSSYLVYFIESVYPGREQYKNGVRGTLFYAERKNPNSKVINHKLKISITRKLLLDGSYEVLLVNEQGLITEGSRSNIFFLKNQTLITAPDSMILSGITRKYIMKICEENNIKVELECVRADRLSEYDAVFMTGTSPMVLPFCCIDTINFKAGLPIFDKLRMLYLEKVGESIHRFRSEQT